MSDVGEFVPRLRRALVRFGPFTVALITLLLPVAARAQTATGGGISITNSQVNSTTGLSPIETSTATVSGATGPVKTVSVELDGVKTTGGEQDGVFYVSLVGAFFMLTSPDGTQFEFLGNTGDQLDGCDSNQNNQSCDGLQGTAADVITVVDGAHYAPNDVGSLGAQYFGWETAYMPYTVAPSSYWGYTGPTNAPPLPTTPNQAAYPQVDGCASPLVNGYLQYGCTAGPNGTTTPTFNSVFGEKSADGTWTLSLMLDTGGYADAVSITGWKLYLTYSTATVIETKTAVASSANPASYANSASGASVQLTATVTTNPSGQGTPTGTVAFTANGTTISGCGSVAVNGSGEAQCTASLAQGNNAIIASYTPTGSFVSSSGSMTELVEVTAAQSGDEWCSGSNSPITMPQDSVPVAYPSVIAVSGYGGATVGNVSVVLNGVTGQPSGISQQYMLVAPGGTHNLEFLDYSWGGYPVSNVNLTISDTGTQLNPDATPVSGTYLPYDGNTDNNPDTFPSSPSPGIDGNIPQAPATGNHPQTIGTYTLQQAFSGAPADGDWALYLTGEAPVTVNSWCIDLSINTGAATTTTVSSNHQHATFGQSVQITATVSSTSTVNQGTVTFTDTTTGTPVTLASNVAVSNGAATYTTSGLAEGDHKITATYSGTSSYDASFGSVEQRVDRATVVTNVSGNTWRYCNPGAVTIQESLSGAYTPNPSNIFVTGLPGAFASAALTLDNFSVTATATYETEALIEGPTGTALDFFANTGGVNYEVIESGNYTFEDGGTEVPDSGTNINPGTYAPTAYAFYAGGADTFTSSYFYPAPGSFSLAGPAGTATFSSVFPDTLNPNGTWSLFFNQHYGEDAQVDGAANGWCMQLTGTPPVVVANVPGTGSFTQGQQGSFTVDIENNGPGSTGDPSGGSDPMTVTDTLNSAFTFASGTGSGWNCGSSSGQNVICTNDSAVGASQEYPELTINVNVSGTASGTIDNSVTASGAGAASTNSGTEQITIDVPPGITSGAATTFTVGTSGTFGVTGTGTPAPTFSTSGLPSGVTLSSAGLLSGTPAPGTGGVYNITITASNGVGSNATQPFTLTVDEAPGITSASGTTFAPGTNGSFAVTATGYPAPTFGETGAALPGTVTLSSSGALSGTPGAGTGGTYGITITASNGVGTNATQSFTLTVSASAMTINWAPVGTIIAGDAGTGVLNASASCGACGSFSYTESQGGAPVGITSTTALGAGSYTITASFAPTNSAAWSANSAQATLVVSGESVWIVDGGGGTSELAGNGFGITSSADAGANVAVAIDNAGNVWSVGAGPLLEATGQTGIPQHSINSGGGLNTPAGVAIDGNGQVWVTDGNNAVSLFSNAGAAISPSGGMMDPTLLSSPAGIAVDLGGSVWIANTGNSSLTRILGGAAPAAPLATAAAGGTTGAKP